jgi:predicted nucleic acid-binding protein
MRIYLDSAPTIYLFEGTKDLREAVQNKLEGTKDGSDVIMTSELTRLECPVKPIVEQDKKLLALYDAFFAGKEVTVILPDRRIWEQATIIRVKYGFRVPDALHLASAIESECDIFLTNDHRLQRCCEIQVEVIS